MAKFRLLCLFLCFLLLIQPLLLPVSATQQTTETDSTTETTEPDRTVEVPQVAFGTFTAEDESVTNGCRTMDGQRPLLGSGKMLQTTQAAFLYEVNSQTIVYAYNPDQKMYPASLVKIMTTLIAVENGDLTKNVTVTRTALDALPDGAMTVELQEGEILTLEQLLHCMMCGSANDAATVIAEHIAGSQEAFVEMMNRRAAEIGCTGTNFTNAHGLHEDELYTTARDMCKIVHEAMKNPDFMNFFSTVNFKVPATNLFPYRYLETTNYLMTPGVSQIYYDSRVTGGRTGITDALERSLVSTAESRGMSYIIVVLCAVPTMSASGKTVFRFGNYEETNDLIDIAFSNMSIYRVLSEDNIINQYSVTGGENDITCGPDRLVYSVLPDGLDLDKFTVRYENSLASLTAPVGMGDEINRVQIWYGNVCLAQGRLLTRNSSQKIGSGNSNDVSGGEKSNILPVVLAVLGILAAIAVVVFVVLLIVRRVHITRKNVRRRRRRRNRVRSK